MGAPPEERVPSKHVRRGLKLVLMGDRNRLRKFRNSSGKIWEGVITGATAAKGFGQNSKVVRGLDRYWECP